MKFPGFGNPKQCLKLIGPLGKEYSVDVVVRNDQLCLCAKHGQVLEIFPLKAVSWLPCALPGKDHCLSLRIESNKPRDLVLKASNRERIADLIAQLDTASQQLDKHTIQEAVISQPLKIPLVIDLHQNPEPNKQMEERKGSIADSPTAGSVSFGRPSDDGGSTDLEECQRSPPCSPLGADAQAGPIHNPERSFNSAAATKAGKVQKTITSEGADAGVKASQNDKLSVRLLFCEAQPHESKVASQVQQLEGLVGQLNRELDSSRSSTPKAARSGGLLYSMESRVSPLSSPKICARCSEYQIPGYKGSKETAADRHLDCPLLERDTAAAESNDFPGKSSIAPSRCGQPITKSSSREGLSSQTIPGVHLGATSCHVQTLLEENDMLAQRILELEQQLGVKNAQLDTAAAANVRLAREARQAVCELQAAGTAVAAGQCREEELQASLAAAIKRCETLGRELAVLTGKLEGSVAQCQELRRMVEELEREKTVLTAALTTAQLKLKDATPEGLAKQMEELRRQQEAADKGMAAAAEKLATSERMTAQTMARLAESQKREVEVAEHIQQAAKLLEEAHAAQQAGLARERRLGAELEQLREHHSLGKVQNEQGTLQQLQHKVEALSGEKAELLFQVTELHHVGEELSKSCAQLEASLQAAVAERDGLRSMLSLSQQAQQAAAQQWAADRAGLESKLEGITKENQGPEGSASGSRSQLQILQEQLEAARLEVVEARQRGSAREHELNTELRLLEVRSEAELRSMKERLEGLLSQQAKAEAQRVEHIAAHDAALSTAQRETEVAQEEGRRMQMELRRVQDEQAVTYRTLQLELSTLKEENSRFKDELSKSMASMEAQQTALEAAQEETARAQSQVTALSSAQASLSQERKELLHRLDRVSVERDRAIRERAKLDLQCSAAQQQNKLLQAVIQQDARSKSRAKLHQLVTAISSKENAGFLLGAGMQEPLEGLSIKAQRRRAGRHVVLMPSHSSSD